MPQALTSAPQSMHNGAASLGRQNQVYQTPLFLTAQSSLFYLKEVPKSHVMNYYSMTKWEQKSHHGGGKIYKRMEIKLTKICEWTHVSI